VTIKLHDLKGAMQLDHSKDVYACFNFHQLQFQCINASCSCKYDFCISYDL